MSVPGKDQGREGEARKPGYIEMGHCVRFGECVHCNASLRPGNDGLIEKPCPGPFEREDDSKDWI